MNCLRIPKEVARSTKYALIILNFWVVATIDAAASGEGGSKLDELGVGYWIEEKRVEELYYVTLEAYGLVNDVMVKFNKFPERSIIAVSVSDVIVDGGVNFEKFRELHESYYEFLKIVLNEHNGDQCFIGGVKTPKGGVGQSIIGEDLTVIVVFDNRGNTTEEQLVCLYLGTLIGVGVPRKKLEYFSKFSASELASIIINMEY